MSGDRCETCGFDADDYTARDLTTADRWLRVMRDEATDTVTVPDTGPVADTLASIERAAAAVEVADRPHPDVVHEGVHRLRMLGRQLHEAGLGVPAQEGTVGQINLSDGGVPKSAVAVADVARRGLVGDRQANRTHHGRPFQALCLWSTEVIEALQAEGHPIQAGGAGENLTIAGLDWAALRPGARIVIGLATAELSAWAEPCRKNDQWFIGRSDRIDHARHPGWSRIYAWVVEPGTVRVGDPVIVEP